MLEFIQEHWQLLVALVLSVVNFIITLCVHSRSSSKIKGLSTTTTEANASVAEALLSVVSISKELVNEIENKSKVGQETVQKESE